MSEPDANDHDARRTFLLREPVSRETLNRLDTFAWMLTKWSRAMNLVSRATLDALWTRHFLDSAQLLHLAPAGASSWIDLGTGAGFPGLVVAAVAAERRPDLAMTLLDSDTRKCAFLAEATREMALSIRILNRRAEAEPAAKFDIVSARALAPLDRLLEIAEPYRAPGGIALFPKGERVTAELTEAAQRWSIVHETTQSVADPRGVILIVKEVRRVADR